VSRTRQRAAGRGKPRGNRTAVAALGAQVSEGARGTVRRDRVARSATPDRLESDRIPDKPMKKVAHWSNRYKLFAILGCALLLEGPLAARQKTDVIVMQNGDRITGEIKGLDGGVLRVDLDYVDGTLSLDWLKVARLESSQLFLVQTQDGSVYTGTIATAAASPAGQPVRIQIAEETQSPVPVEHARVVKIEETSDSFLRRLSGDVLLGSVYSKGNNTAQYNLGSSIEYQRARWGAQVDFNSNLSSSSGADTSTRNQLNVGAYRRMPFPNYFYSGFGGFLQSSVQGINRQTSVGAGVGRFFKNTNRVRLSLLGGGIWQTTNYEPSTVPIARQSVYGGVARGELQVFLFKKTNLTFNGAIVPSFSDWGRVYYTTNASYYLKFFRDISWDFSFYGNWDTRPPPHLTGGDYGYSSGLKWTFNR
jgi:Protein of unknown function, DUF481